MIQFPPSEKTKGPGARFTAPAPVTTLARSPAADYIRSMLPAGKSDPQPNSPESGFPYAAQRLANSATCGEVAAGAKTLDKV
jgi:hypothetical protein